MSRTWRQADDDDGGVEPPRPGGSSRKSPTRNVSPVPQSSRRTGRTTGLAKKEDAGTSKPGRPRKAGFTAPGVFKPPTSSSNASARNVQQHSTSSQPSQKESKAFLKTAVFKPGSAMKQQNSESALASSRAQASSRSVGVSAMKPPRSALREKDESQSEHTRKAVKFAYPAKVDTTPAKPKPSAKPLSPPRRAASPEKEEKQKKKALKRNMSNMSIIDDPNKLETRWDWTQLLIQHAFKPYRKALSDHDDLLPDPDELDAYDTKDDEDEEQLFVDEIRDQMLDDGQLSEREIASFFAGFTLFNAKVRSLQSQLESAKTMAFQKVVPSGMTTSTRSLADYRSRSVVDFSRRQEKDRVVADEERSRSLLATKGVASDNGISCKFMSIKRIQQDPKTSPEHQKLLKELEEAEKKQKKLEKQIKQAGLQIAQDIPYEEAKEEVAKIAERMQEIGSSEVTHPDKKKQAELREEYFKLEQDMEKFSTALMLTDEYIEEQEEKEMTWEKVNEGPNMEALKKLRRHMPVAVKSLSEAQLCSQPTPNGKKLPKAIAKKFKRTNVLQLLRTNPEDITRMHPSTLENMRVTGMTLTERRAMYAHLKDVGPRWKAMQADAMTERKWTWYTMMRTNFKEVLEQYDYHVQQYGPPGNHPYATRANPKEGCPMIGKQCPLRADQQPSYDDDYGFTEEAEYEVNIVRKADAEDPGAKAASDAAALMREKRSSERLDALKKHYKGVLQVSLASGSCETMDEALDKMEALQMKWIEQQINQGDEPVAEDVKRKQMLALSDSLNDLRLSVLQFAERSGMQLTGKRDANADKMDIRSALELGLCEEVCEAANDFFSGMKQRMKDLSVKDGRMKVSIEQLRDLLDELHERNVKTLETLGVERPAPSRKRKTREAMINEAKEKLQPAIAETPKEEDRGIPAAASAGGRGNLMAAIAGRGRGGAGGRGDLMSAIAGRGRGRDGGGRGDIMSAIAARGAVRGGRHGRDGSGRGDLMSAIAARGSGRDGRGRGRDGSGRGGLMAAIAARGAGRSGRSGRDGGGRGDLIAAIAARGSGRGDGSGRDGGRVDPATKGSDKSGRSAGASGSGRGSGRIGSAGASAGGRGNFLAEIQAKAAAREAADSED